MTGSHDDDASAIRTIIERIEAGFNTNDAELSVADFAEDASVVTATGRRIQGRPALLEAHREGLAGALADEHASYEVADVAFPSHDVAIVHKLGWATDAAGERTTDDPGMVALYVMVKRDRRWWVMARANVPTPASS